MPLRGHNFIVPLEWHISISISKSACFQHKLPEMIIIPTVKEKPQREFGTMNSLQNVIKEKEEEIEEEEVGEQEQEAGENDKNGKVEEEEETSKEKRFHRPDMGYRFPRLSHTADIGLFVNCFGKFSQRNHPLVVLFKTDVEAYQPVTYILGQAMAKYFDLIFQKKAIRVFGRKDQQKEQSSLYIARTCCFV